MLAQGGSRATGGEESGECIREESFTSQDGTGYTAVTNIPRCLGLRTTSLFLVCTMRSGEVSKRAVVRVAGATLLPRPVVGLSTQTCLTAEGRELCTSHARFYLE